MFVFACKDRRASKGVARGWDLCLNVITFENILLTIRSVRLCCAAAGTPSYRFAGLGSNHGPGNQHTGHPATYASFPTDRRFGASRNLEKVNRGSPDVALILCPTVMCYHPPRAQWPM